MPVAFRLRPRQTRHESKIPQSIGLRANMMNHYTVFGGHLSSELALPELPEAASSPADWVLRVAAGPPPVVAVREELGAASVDEGVAVRLFAIPGGYRLEYDDTGTFDIQAGGVELVWYPAPGASAALAQLDVLGRVLAVAFHAAGVYCLHASAVALAGGAVGFIAPKFHGKSTTAYALVNAGARLITDDTLPVLSGTPPLVRPGVQRVRLWGDSVSAVGASAGEGAESAGKFVVDDLSAQQLLRGTSPLAALYLLAPVVSNPGGEAVARSPLSPVESALALVGHAKVGALLGGSERQVLFRRAVALAGTVPVYRLAVARDFDRLPEVVAQIFSWHIARGGVRRERGVGVA